MVVSNQLPDLPVTLPNTINIVRTSDFVQHVRPPPPGVPLDQYTLPGSTRNDCILSGLVIVHLSKPKRARFLQVEHITTARLPASLRQLDDPSAFKGGWGSREVDRTAQKGVSSSDLWVYASSTAERVLAAWSEPSPSPLAGQQWRDVVLHRNVMELSGTGEEGILIDAGPQM